MDLASVLGAERSVAANKRFPNYQATNDDRDVLRKYPAYLKFVLDVGLKTRYKHAIKLRRNYRKLRKRDPVAAARFLRGLRYEMVQYFQAANISHRSTTRNKKVRRWISRYIAVWAREADELHFRAVATRAIERNRRRQTR